MIKYPFALRILHWTIAILILTLIAVGWYMAGLPRDNPLRGTLFMLHKSFGVTVLLLALLRLLVRFTQPLPGKPDAISGREWKLAKLGYVFLYFLMLSTPLVGILMTNAFGFAVSYFGLFDLPKLIITADRTVGKVLEERHEFLAYTLLVLVIGHALAVVKHFVIDKINLLPRMW